MNGHTFYKALSGVLVVAAFLLFLSPVGTLAEEEELGTALPGQEAIAETCQCEIEQPEEFGDVTGETLYDAQQSCKDLGEAAARHFRENEGLSVFLGTCSVKSYDDISNTGTCFCTMRTIKWETAENGDCSQFETHNQPDFAPNWSCSVYQ